MYMGLETANPGGPQTFRIFQFPCVLVYVYTCVLLRKQWQMPQRNDVHPLSAVPFGEDRRLGCD